ncbi:ECF RNA polymerase sigma factor SigE [Kordia antarctica]|uniref:ECF RNA polymerase sigma factor SigE n=1 Tax=Kordia antarctica TaxID=1218801 RepID=A0A7L4ZLW0_9FLAO|nr:RNA polymerase sigma factor [Kordia antarctica]QHI37419.1 ECF RNA polymerase sigma factor SigE [Kordia antarctica]
MSKKFTKIYQKHYDKVHRLCLGYVNGDQALAKDLAQDVFIKVWEHLDQFQQKSSIGTWIYRITVNTCLLFIRKDKKKKQLSFTEIQDEVQEETNDQNRVKQMYVCIHKLKQTERIIILLVLEGLPQKEIAEITGHSHENIRVRVHRIKEKLTKCVSNGI